MKLNRFLSVSLIILLSLITSCNNKPATTISDVLENTLPSVVTVKISEVTKTKTAFGFADTGMTKLSVADVAYAEILKLDNAKGTGSGFIIEEAGKKYIITNAHVIEKAENLNGNITVYTYDRKEHQVRLVGADTYYDIAVLSFVNEPDSIRAINFGSENYRIGQTVFAVGNPLSYFPYSVTQGIISAKNREGMNSKSGYLQTTAMLSPGNSGGPLIDEKGELVGVNTLGVSEAQQLNFSLEARVLKRIVSEIISGGKVVRAFLGIEAAEFVKYSFDDKNKLKTEAVYNKPVLWHIVLGSPAISLSDYIGYEISSLNENTISSNEDLLNALEKVKPGQTVTFVLEKDGIKLERAITAEELNDKRLADIAHFYFQTHYNISLENNSSGVILAYPSGVQQNELQFYDADKEKFISYIPRGEKAYILACGNKKDIKNLDFWKVDSYKDLGNALRLSVPTGQISFLEYDTKHPPLLIRGLISDRKDLISKTVLY